MCVSQTRSIKSVERLVHTTNCLDSEAIHFHFISVDSSNIDLETVSCLTDQKTEGGKGESKGWCTERGVFERCGRKRKKKRRSEEEKI